MNRVYLSLGLAVFVVEAVLFNCETGTKLKSSARKVTTPTQDSCCEVQGKDEVVQAIATCGNTSPAPDDDPDPFSFPDTNAFECPPGSYVGVLNDGATAPFDEEKCCVEYELSCSMNNENLRREFTLRFGGGGNNEYTCPADQVINRTAYQEAPSDETCCQKFIPTCMLTSLTGATDFFGNTINFFECPEGKTLNQSSMMSTPVSESMCCETFVPKCGFASGDLTDPKWFECDPGSVSKEELTDGTVYFLNATQEACCMTVETFTCQLSNAVGQPYVCPSDMAPTNDFGAALDADQKPSDENCCVPPTCGNMKQGTCATDRLQGQKCMPGLVPAPGTEDLVIGGVNSFDDCCIRESEPEEAFSSANRAVASSLAIGLIVIALL